MSNNNKNSSALEVATENELPLRELIVACGNCLNADASSSMFPYPHIHTCYLEGIYEPATHVVALEDTDPLPRFTEMEFDGVSRPARRKCNFYFVILKCRWEG